MMDLTKSTILTLLQVPLPDDMNWWELFSVTTEQLLEVVRVLHDLYQRPPAHYVPPSTDSGAQGAKASTPDLVSTKLPLPYIAEV
jgi:hypothetical protein